MSDLSARSTPTLHSIKARLTNWIVYVAAVDLLVLVVLVYLFTSRSPAQVMPLVPVFTLPTIAIVLILRRVRAVTRELVRRGD